MQKIRSCGWLVFDFEVFPKWWCVVFSTTEGEMFHITSDNYSLINLKDICDKNILVGFNNKDYDMKILDCILKNNTPERIYTLSHNMIHNLPDIYDNVFWWNKYNFTDLYDDWDLSLKEYESNKGMDIRESKISFDKVDLTEEDKEETLKYCYHDVKATLELLKEREEYVNAKLALSELFDIDPFKALKSTNAKLASIVLKAQPVNRELETKYKIPERIKAYIYNNLPKDVIDMFDILNYDDKTARLFDNDITFGIGGIHSVCNPEIVVRSTDTHILIEYDVRSLYPNLIMLFNFMSRNVPDPLIYNKIYRLRIEYKEKAAKEKSINGKSDLFWKYYFTQAGLKKILNTTYGAMKNRYNGLYDPYIAGSICYTGQLLLAALACKLSKTIPELKVIQTNTDGILLYFPRNKLKDVQSVIHEWEFMTGFVMEDEEMETFFQRDVNNYIECTGNPKDPYKLKGKWSNQAILEEVVTNLNAPITHKALLEYYCNGIPIEKTINECNNLIEFCFTTKRGRTYSTTYYEYNGEFVVANKVNRVVATIDEKCGTIYKYKPLELKQPEEFKSLKDWNKYCKNVATFEDKYNLAYGRMDKAAEIPMNCYICNGSLDWYDKLDKSWYINFCNKKIKDLKDISVYEWK